jgi:hypothetical protein
MTFTCGCKAVTVTYGFDSDHGVGFTKRRKPTLEDLLLPLAPKTEAIGGVSGKCGSYPSPA